MDLIKICDRVISWGFYVLFFLVPLVFSSQTSELFEYNKMMLTYGLTIIIVSAWVIKMLVAKRFIYRRSFLEIPLILYLGSHILSTIFSIDPHISIWGYYSRFHEGLLASVSYIILYFAAVSNLNREHVKRILYVSFASAVVVSFWGILEHFGHSPSCLIITGNFGVDCWIQDVKNRVFATLGQPNWMAAYLNVIILAILGFALSVKKKLYLFLIVGLFAAALLFTRSRSGFAGLAAGLGVFTLLIVPISNKLKLLTCAVALIIGSVVGIKWYQNLPAPGPGVTDSEAIRKPVWEGAVRVWERYPVFGSGVETFAYSFYKDRPASKNLDSEWDFLYNKAHNEYLNLLATTGTIGFLSYLGILGVFSIWIIRRRRELLVSALFAAWVTILVTNFFGFSVVIIGLYFFLIPAWAKILASQE